MKMTFSSDNKRTTNFDFPKLYLDHGERARIVCIEETPEVNFVHTLKAPSITNGTVDTETIKNKDGSTSQRDKTVFIGRHLCFGDPNTMMEKGKDTVNCPTCAAAQQSDHVGAATRRFAMHVVQYKVQPGKFQVQTPFQAELVVWAFTDRAFDKLTDMHEEHGDLRQKDLLLGPCENKTYQNFDIQPGGSAAWLENEDTKKFVQTLYAENKIADLNVAIGRKVTKAQAEEDIEKVLLKVQQAYGSGNSTVDAAVSAPVTAATMDLDAMLAPAKSEAAAAPITTEALEVPSEAASPEAAPEAAPEPKAAEAEAKPALDFDALMSGLQ